MIEGHAVAGAARRKPTAEPPALLEYRRAETAVAQQPRAGHTGDAGADDRDPEVGWILDCHERFRPSFVEHVIRIGR